MDSGAEATSVPPSIISDTVSGPWTRPSVAAGEKLTRSGPAGGAPGASAGAVAGGAIGGAVAGGAIGGAVAGGAAVGGLMAGAVTPGVFTAEPAAGGWPDGVGAGVPGCRAAAAAGPDTTSVGLGA